MLENYLQELADLDVKLFAINRDLTDEIRERMRQIVADAPEEIMQKDNQSILRYAYTKALEKGE